MKNLKNHFGKMQSEMTDNYKKESKAYSSLREMQIKAAHYQLSPIDYQKVKDQKICFNTYSINA